MKSRNDFTLLKDYQFYLQTYYAGIALNAFMVGPDYKSVDTKERVVMSATLISQELVKEIFNDKTFQR